MILFPDTHLFLHFRDLRELPWNQVTSDTIVCLVVGRTVQKELEKKKYELRGRAQDRARIYTRKLAEIVTGQAPLIVRERSPRVTLDFLPRERGWISPPDLDAQWQDDQLVADALAYIYSHSGEDVAIVAGDAGVIATANAHGVRVVRPGDDWEMPAEASPEEKALKKLQQENHELRQKGPKLSADLMQNGSEPVKHIELALDWYAPLTEAEMGVVLNEVKAKNPLVQAFDRRPDGEVADPTSWDLPSDQAIETYRTAYEVWLQEVTIFVRRIAKGSTKVNVRSEFKLQLRNVGTEPALRTRFSMEVVGGFSLWASEDKEKNINQEGTADIETADDEILVATAFPSPPSAPVPRRRRLTIPDIDKWRSLGRINPMVFSEISRHEKLVRSLGASDQLSQLFGSSCQDIFSSIIPPAHATAVAQPIFDISKVVPHFPKERDPNAFYWRTGSDEKNGATKWELDCDEYSHQDDDVIFDFYLSFQSHEERDYEGMLRVRIAANNLRAPIDISYQLKVRCMRADTISRLRSLLPL